MVCFSKRDVLLDQTYYSWNNAYSLRYVFDFSRRTACPPAMMSRFEQLRRSYGELRKFSLYSEYKSADGWLLQALDRLVPHPELK